MIMRKRPSWLEQARSINFMGLVLLLAIGVFWAKGLSGTSLDDLASAMKMNRPSIYNAFGNKEEIYRRALARFCGQLDLGRSQAAG